MGEIIGGVESTTDEAEEIGWFYRDQLPPLNDGHEPRINFGFDFLENSQLPPYFEQYLGELCLKTSIAQLF